MRILFIKPGNGIRVEYDTQDLFRMTAEANKIITLGRDPYMDTVILPEGVEAQTTLDCIKAGLAAAKNTAYVFIDEAAGTVDTIFSGEPLVIS